MRNRKVYKVFYVDEMLVHVEYVFGYFYLLDKACNKAAELNKNNKNKFKYKVGEVKN